MKLNRKNLNQMNNASSLPAGEKIVHIGLGAFHRAHQAWYTDRVDHEQAWGIVAFTGRSAQAAETLMAQDGLFTLVTRDSAGDSFQIIDSIVRAEDGNNTVALTEVVSNPNTAIVTLTITEAAYGMDTSGHIDKRNPPVVLQRLAEALNARREVNGQGLAIISCDNMPANGELLKVAMNDLFAEYGPEAKTWLAEKVSFVSTSIDRITPKTTNEDIDLVENATGWQDAAVVVTEPFSDWVLEGEFPLGRPQWELAGAKFVEHIEPFENRKLWLLNGAHSLLAYAGQLRGHETVAEAINDPTCRSLVEAFWDEAARHLDENLLEVKKYRSALLARFKNARIAHRLAQIAIDGTTKLRVRVAAVANQELAAGRNAQACAEVLAAWVTFVLANEEIADSQAEKIKLSKSQLDLEIDKRLVALVDPSLAANPEFMNRVTEARQLIKI